MTNELQTLWQNQKKTKKMFWWQIRTWECRGVMSKVYRHSLSVTPDPIICPSLFLSLALSSALSLSLSLSLSLCLSCYQSLYIGNYMLDFDEFCWKCWNLGPIDCIKMVMVWGLRFFPLHRMDFFFYLRFHHVSYHYHHYDINYL